jgi:hypothetical protein
MFHHVVDCLLDDPKESLFFRWLQGLFAFDIERYRKPLRQRTAEKVLAQGSP